jgi:predicted ATPase/DNA-binding winged helix-turn-helix (wHTH) protein
MAIIEFGRFRIVPHRRELLADGQPIHLGGRTFDVLLVLIEGHGAAVAKDALMQRVWPNRIVEESSLHVQISALRNAFGADRNLIRTISGRGYQFTGEIRTVAASPHTPAVAGTAVPVSAPRRAPTNLPEPVSELIDREPELREIVSLAAAHRIVTLTGAGGIGKTRLALAAAHQLLPRFADGVWLAEFSSLAHPGLVPATVAAVVGLELGAGEVSAQRVAQALADRHLLLVLDTCEHVIAAAAALAEALLQAGSAVRILATSREPLRAEGERIYPAPPLAVPAAEREDPWPYGAVQLFVVRSRASGAQVSEDRHSAAAIAAICRRLDGIPLAIELAAARAAALGIETLAARLDDRFRLLTGGRRTALPRHQTLRATLDWSYELLPEPERVILRRLAVFSGVFSLEAASAVAASVESAPAEVVDGLSNLVAKSLVAAEVDGTVVRYRLLDTTRAYALEKLGEASEREQLARRHAEYYRDLFERAESEWEMPPAAEWLTDYGRQIDNLRAALDWAFSPAGNTSFGVALTAAAVPLWMQLSLLDECRGRVEQALAALGAEANRDLRREIKLHAALGVSVISTRGATDPEAGAVWTKALEVAESLDDAEYQLRSLWGLWFFHTAAGRHRVALELAQRCYTLATNRSDSNHRLVAERLIGVSQFYLGDLPAARRHVERVVADYVGSDHRSRIIRSSVSAGVTARVFLAWVLWLQGFPDQAVRTAESSIEDARATNHALTLCFALALAACPIALLVGDLAAAEHYMGTLLDHSSRYALARWRAVGRGYQGVLAIKRGDIASGLPLLRAGFDELGEAKFAVMRLITFVMAEVLGHAGQISEGLAVAEEAIAQSERAEERSLLAEFVRVKGELLLLQGAPGAAAAAEDHFRQALEWAHRQGALAWELRAATSLARLLRDQNRSAEAISLLAPVYDRFTEGFETADLKAAKVLIDGLCNSKGHKAPLVEVAKPLVELIPELARRSA